MFFWNSLAFSMIQQMLAIWSLVPLPFLNPACTSGSSQFRCTSLAWRILSITLLACEMSTTVHPGGSDSKESACSVGDPGSIPWVRKIPWRRKWLSTPVFFPGKFHGQRSLVGYSPWGPKESDMTEQLVVWNNQLFQIGLMPSRAHVSCLKLDFDEIVSVLFAYLSSPEVRMSKTQRIVIIWVTKSRKLKTNEASCILVLFLDLPLLFTWRFIRKSKWAWFNSHYL